MIHHEWYAFNTGSYTADHFEAESNKISQKDFKVKVEINVEDQKQEIRYFAVYSQGWYGKPKVIEIK